jgi:hypothetical protein
MGLRLLGRRGWLSLLLMRHRRRRRLPLRGISQNRLGYLVLVNKK